MPAPHEITFWHYAGFIVVVLVLLALDLGVFHKSAHVVKVREALMWTTLWCVLALAFGLGLGYWRGRDDAVLFVTGYLLELTLSMDNVFVIALIFSYFRIPPEYQHRVLFWGILGALIMRGGMIGVGAALISKAHWILYLFGIFLIYSGAKMAMAKEEGVHPDQSLIIRLLRKFFPISRELDGQNFVTHKQGGTMFTPLVPVLAMVETTDLVFALDSIPAIFGVTQQPFIVFTSNVFAILGLRSLYFVLAGAIEYFRYLKFGLAIVLVYIGIKMLAERWVHMPIAISLMIIVGIILTSMLVSVLAAYREKRGHSGPGASGS
jgi:tellurite resistance protein TerC